MDTPALALAALTANVDAWYADAITYDAFGERQRVTWDAIRARGEAFNTEVLALWRERAYGRR